MHQQEVVEVIAYLEAWDRELEGGLKPRHQARLDALRQQLDIIRRNPVTLTPAQRDFIRSTSHLGWTKEQVVGHLVQQIETTTGPIGREDRDRIVAELTEDVTRVLSTLP